MDAYPIRTMAGLLSSVRAERPQATGGWWRVWTGGEADGGKGLFDAPVGAWLDSARPARWAGRSRF